MAAPSPTTSSPNAEHGALHKGCAGPANADAAAAAAAVVALVVSAARRPPRPPPRRPTRRSSGSCAATACTARGASRRRCRSTTCPIAWSPTATSSSTSPAAWRSCGGSTRRSGPGQRWTPTACAEAERALLRESIDRLRPQLALLRIDSEPPGAEIYLGRRDLGSLGQTPKLIAVPEGKATLVLDLDGHRPAEVPVEPQRGKEQVIAIKLDRVFGRVLVTGIPETSRGQARQQRRRAAAGGRGRGPAAPGRSRHPHQRPRSRAHPHRAEGGGRRGGDLARGPAPDADRIHRRAIQRRRGAGEDRRPRGRLHAAGAGEGGPGDAGGRGAEGRLPGPASRGGGARDRPGLPGPAAAGGGPPGLGRHQGSGRGGGGAGVDHGHHRRGDRRLRLHHAGRRPGGRARGVSPPTTASTRRSASGASAHPATTPTGC